METSLLDSSNVVWIVFCIEKDVSSAFKGQIQGHLEKDVIVFDGRFGYRTKKDKRG